MLQNDSATVVQNLESAAEYVESLASNARRAQKECIELELKLLVTESRSCKPHLHVLQDKHCVPLIQALAVELHDVLIMAELVEHIDLTAERLEDGGAIVCNQLLHSHLCGAVAQALVYLHSQIRLQEVVHAWNSGKNFN